MTIEAITAAALSARQRLCSEAMAETRDRIAPLNAATVRANFVALMNGADPERGVTTPIKATRCARHSKESVKRGFRFTIEGLPGVFKLNPLRRIA